MSDFETLEHAHTPIGTLYLGRRPRTVGPETGWIYEIRISGNLLMSSRINISEKQLATSALALHGGTGPLRVLVGGLGLGYTAQAALAAENVESVRVVEKMDFVIGWMEGGLLPLSEELAADARFEIVKDDIYSALLGPVTTRYDLILVDVDHAPDQRLADSDEDADFYSVVGQRNVAQHLAPGGVLAVWSCRDHDGFADVLAEVYPRSCRELSSWVDDEEDGATFSNVLFFAGLLPEG